MNNGQNMDIIQQSLEGIPQRSGEFSKRLSFFRRNQNAEESLHEYLNEIRRLAKACKFETQEELIIRDRFVLGLHDRALQDRIVMAGGGNPSLTETCDIIFAGTVEMKGE